MKITLGQLRRLIVEDAFNFTTTGVPTKIAPEGGDKWKKVKADARMAATALEKLNDAIMDDDEEAAAKWIQNLGKFTKSAYMALLH